MMSRAGDSRMDKAIALASDFEAAEDDCTNLCWTDQRGATLY